MAYFILAGVKLKFEKLLILEKKLENLLLEQNIFSIFYFQLNWGRKFFQNFS